MHMESSRQRPNILLIQTDQQRWDALGAAGNPDIHTPNLDALAERGAYFDHHFVQNPVCMPSRASMLTGRYPSDLGITHMAVPVPATVETLPRILRRYGYRTGLAGKLHFLPHANRDHREPHPNYGFDVMELSDEPGPYEDDYLAWVRARAPEFEDTVSLGLPPAAAQWRGLMDDDANPPPERSDYSGPHPFPAPDELTHAAFVADRTMAFLDQQTPGTPFFAVAGFYAPHAPLVTPQRFLDLYDRETLTIRVRRDPNGPFSEGDLRRLAHGYYALVSEVDHHVGSILDHLEQLGLIDSTIVVFTSDHGEWLGHNGRVAKGYPADDAVARVPLIVSGPGIAPSTHSGIIESVDIVPTVLDLAAVNIPTHVQGRSAASLLRDGATPPLRDSALVEHTGWRSLRTERFHYVIHDDGEEHLWDLASDPAETDDVALDPRYVGEIARLRHLMLTRIITAHAPTPRTWPY